MNLNLNKLSKYSTWVALVVFVLVILSYQNLFSNDLNNDRSMVGQGWSMEYDWSVQVSEGMPLYPVDETRFIEGKTLAYMPGYFLVTGNLMKVFGTSAVVGKLVSAFAVLGTALLIYKVGVKISSRKFLSIILGVLFLVYPTVINYTGMQMKIELLGVFFTTVSLFLVLDKKYLWAVPFAVLAFFTKQYFIGLPIAVGLYLLFRDRKTLLRYVTLYAVLIGAGFGLGELITHGVFFRHTVLFMFDPQFGSLEAERTVVGSLIGLGYLTPVMVVALYGMWRTRSFSKSGVLGLYLVVSLAILVFSISKVGSGINYTLDALVAGCCLSSLVLSRRELYNEQGYNLPY